MLNRKVNVNDRKTYFDKGDQVAYETEYDDRMGEYFAAYCNGPWKTAGGGQVCGGRCSKSGLGAPNIAGSAIWKAGGDTERPERLGRAGGGKGAWGALGTPSKARARQDKAQRKRDEVFLLPYIYFLRALLSSPDSSDQCVNRYAT